MAGNRTLKLSILADVDDLNKKLKAANGDVETSAGKLEKFGKVAGAAFLAAAAAAGRCPWLGAACTLPRITSVPHPSLPLPLPLCALLQASSSARTPTTSLLCRR